MTDVVCSSTGVSQVHNRKRLQDHSTGKATLPFRLICRFAYRIHAVLHHRVNHLHVNLQFPSPSYSCHCSRFLRYVRDAPVSPVYAILPSQDQTGKAHSYVPSSHRLLLLCVYHLRQRRSPPSDSLRSNELSPYPVSGSNGYPDTRVLSDRKPDRSVSPPRCRPGMHPSFAQEM